MEYLNDVNYKDCVGKIFKSKLSGDFKVLKYNDSGDYRLVEIQGGKYDLCIRSLLLSE